MLHVAHECEVETDQEDVFFLLDRNFFRKAFNAFRSSLMASERNPGARKYLRSHASIISEKRRHFQYYKHILHPFSTFRFFWDIVMILTITCLLLATPYYAAFKIKKRSPYWTVCKNLLLFLCCMDIIVNFMTGYFDKLLQSVVMEPKKIMKNYVIYGTFLPDLLGSLPTDIAFVITWQEATVTRELVSLMCGFRMFSLSSYMTKIVHAYDVPVTLYEVCVMIFWLMLAFQWQSCLYWIVPIATTSMHLPRQPDDDFWIHEFNLWEESRALQYLHSLLRAVTIFLSSGFLHRKPRNEADLTLVILLQILGSLVIWILIARVNQLYRSTNSSRIKYQDIMAQVKEYMKRRQLPYLTRDRIVDYYEFCFQHRYFYEVEILNTLSPQMRQEIGMHVCRKLVENVTFFSNLPLLLLTRIVALLKSEIFLPNDVIVRANQPGDCMYFIANGTVAIYTVSGKEVCHLEDGAHFGEIALVMPDSRRVASVVAVDICELYRLDRADFARTIHPYPMLWEQIKKIAIERHERTTILEMH
ncbi:PREDICTED: potassium/sodium hyperpolarization-activated cyclic nucleotide-gated channel 1-like [Wasmannia auropunctata]|uniref:potassium/sodium hyperpolarization-activated cyclic nucleotide-gated channel 1-like n=1 Tax=Wasmannia auropunctata TaxID=64793 RepID=UPI0005EEE1D0|nr:PREDICTED: potassium/sodium hyperpolarization-activated cyclic nucleotide-gated channel 1-like [Wasmannia auropunctata]XP_011694096.1 PREDICTED: potassium/sodium hyperpolarization-activated cyclic nucleotide-gated channel 1-like [Wasmannia auropunctata]XP_011694097.1 PREDICTED: potassium/sodium hyperpolarization-activated cyclic nucleotide-gated channel 1-like [Wasmannia auropunctata]XP_011694098.1 PREDICTED: potassium/sodium hyperpolarization-activated cyclic nucleotide-gated channel 1-like 